MLRADGKPLPLASRGVQGGRRGGLKLLNEYLEKSTQVGDNNACMYAYMYIAVCLCMRVCIGCVCVYVCMSHVCHMYVPTCMYYIYECMYVCMYVCPYACIIYMNVCIIYMNVCMYVHVCMCVSIVCT